MILDNIKYFILDEADRMLDMGFGPEIKKVVTNYTMQSKENRQTLMFSATFPEEVQQIASEYLNDYVFLTVGRVGSTTSDIEQHVMQLQEYDKREKLCEILNKSSKYIVKMVFTSCMSCIQNGWKCCSNTSVYLSINQNLYNKDVDFSPESPNRDRLA